MRPRARDLLLFSGHEPIRGDDRYLNFFSYLEGGLPVTLPLTPDALAMDLQFRDTIALTWPRHAKPQGLGGSPHASQATYSTAIIGWHPVHDASEYEVQLTRITRTANSIGSKGTLQRRLTGTSLPLTSFPPEMKSQEAPPDEYHVQVYAFDGAGRLVAASEADYNRAFKLVGATRLAAEPESATCEKPLPKHRWTTPMTWSYGCMAHDARDWSPTLMQPTSWSTSRITSAHAGRRAYRPLLTSTEVAPFLY
jgi:hypothetical protein